METAQGSQSKNSSTVQLHYRTPNAKLRESSFKRMEKRIFLACDSVLRKTIPSNEYLKNLETILGHIVKAKRVSLEAFHASNGRGLGVRHLFHSEELHEFEKTIRTKQQLHQRAEGRPRLDPEIAIVLYSYLELYKGNRTLIDSIGYFISPNKDLHQKIDKKYGDGAFNSLNMYLPCMEDRWERGVKSSLQQQSLKYAANVSPTWANRISGKIDNIEDKQHLLEIGLSPIDFRLFSEGTCTYLGKNLMPQGHLKRKQRESRALIDSLK